MQKRIILVDFNPQLGAEIMKTRPAVVISNSRINSKKPIVTVVPLRSNLDLKEVYSPIIYSSFTNGLDRDSFADVDQIKSIDKLRIKDEIGILSDDDFAEIIAAIDIVFSTY